MSCWEVEERRRGVAPAEEISNGGTAAALSVEEARGRGEAGETMKERLIETRVLAKREILDDGKVLVVISDKNDAFKGRARRVGFSGAAGAGGWVLEAEGNESFDFGDLGSFLHDDVVVSETGCGDFSSL